ncbi:MAG: metal ABC transporter substrate-binding protein [Treponema sp.]|nr:metal ABC transporter substrate-binding protein [Treponema sp.]
MRKLKNILAGFFILFSAFVFAAGKTASAGKTMTPSKKSIVCTSFPEYDWVLNILGSKAENFEVILLQNKGTDLHSYQPTIKDMAKIAACDLFIYVGGESDVWVEKALKNSTNKNQLTINLMELLGDKVREEEIVEGMQVSEQHEAEEETEYDEHIWLSLRNAIFLTEELCRILEKLDSQNAVSYKENTASYVKQLDSLDKEFSKTVVDAKIKTLLFGDRFPFRYFVDDYNLNYYAAFVGCSAESEAKFETIAFLSKKVDELGIKTILTIEKSTKKVAKSIASNSKAKDINIIEMDSLQSVSANEILNGKTYLSVMKENLKVLQTALNQVN